MQLYYFVDLMRRCCCRGVRHLVSLREKPRWRAFVKQRRTEKFCSRLVGTDVGGQNMGHPPRTRW